jgi:hypothetical protein
MRQRSDQLKSTPGPDCHCRKPLCGVDLAGEDGVETAGRIADQVTAWWRALWVRPGGMSVVSMMVQVISALGPVRGAAAGLRPLARRVERAVRPPPGW